MMIEYCSNKVLEGSQEAEMKSLIEMLQALGFVCFFINCWLETICPLSKS